MESTIVYRMGCTYSFNRSHTKLQINWSILFETMTLGWYTSNGSHVRFSKLGYTPVPEIALILAKMQTLVKYRILWHYILVFFAYISICLCVSSNHRANSINYLISFY